MAISQAMCTSFKVGLLNGDFDFGAGTTQVFKIALYTTSASLSAATTNYTAPADPNADPTSTNEVTQTGTGYTAGGKTLTVSAVPTSSGTTAYLDFSDVTWSSASITAAGALIYLADGATNPAVAVLSFGGSKTSTSGDFTIQFPAADASNAIIRIA